METDREQWRITLRYDEALVAEIVQRREELQALERRFSQDAVERTGLSVGEVLRNPDTGATYRVESVSVYTAGIGRSRPAAIVRGRRTYSTGRSDASSSSHLDLHQLRRIEA